MKQVDTNKFLEGFTFAIYRGYTGGAQNPDLVDTDSLCIYLKDESVEHGEVKYTSYCLAFINLKSVDFKNNLNPSELSSIERKELIQIDGKDFEQFKIRFEENSVLSIICESLIVFELDPTEDENYFTNL